MKLVSRFLNQQIIIVFADPVHDGCQGRVTFGVGRYFDLDMLDGRQGLCTIVPEVVAFGLVVSEV